MKKSIFFFILLLSSLLFKAQNLLWTNPLSASYNAPKIVVDIAGNVYTVCSFENTIDCDPGPAVVNLVSSGGFDIYISKFDVNGNFIWAKKIGGTDYDDYRAITIDNSGYLYLSGQAQSTTDFDPGPGITNLSSVNNNKTYIAKFDFNGNLIWVKAFEGTGNSNPNTVHVDNIGNIFSVGGFGQGVDFDPGAGVYNLDTNGQGGTYIVKLDTAGNFLWAKSFIGYNVGSNSYSLTTDIQGNVYNAGYSANSVDFDPGPGISIESGSGMYIVKLDSLGNFKWVKKFIETGGGGGTFVQDLYTDFSGNIYTTGSFRYTVDFDPGPLVQNLYCGYPNSFIAKLDSAGNFKWANSFKGHASYSNAIKVDQQGYIYTAGAFHGLIDFDPGPGSTRIFSNAGDFDFYFSVLDSNGNFVSAQTLGGPGEDYTFSMAIDEAKHIHIAGTFNGTVDFDPSNTIHNLNTVNQNGFLAKYEVNRISGRIFNDLNSNCQIDTTELGLPFRHAIINPGNIVIETNQNGIWYIDSLPLGTYTINVDTSGNWTPTCTSQISFTVTDPNSYTIVSPVGLINTNPCASPEVSVNAPFLRRCFSDQKIYVQACNLSLATGSLPNAFVELELDPLLTPSSSSLPYTTISNNLYRFNIGTLNPGQCVDFWIATTISCNAVLGQTICMEANIFPEAACVFDTTVIPPPVGFVPCSLPWDNSDLSVNGWCQNDSIYFAVTNNASSGIGDMTCYSALRLFIDGYFVILDSVQLTGGQSDTLSFAGNGRAWRLEADQHPLHPGNSNPSATVELCGDSAYWTPGLVNILPQNNADPINDIYCGLVTGSYDPNDKTGYPLGVTDTHFVAPNGQIDYLIRFQNTGTDTAFTVVIRDTLDTDLDIFSVVSGVSDHDYSFRIYGPRVLEWTFNNIMLPDSTTDEIASHGFVSFHVNQNSNLTNGTEINNTADIYFDFNAPVITNTTSHVINRNNQLPNWIVRDTVLAVGCGEYIYNGITYTQSGSYWQIKNGTDGIDTLVTLYTTINAASTVIQNGNTLTVNASSTDYQWIDCATGSQITGATGQIFTAVSSGNYAVIVSENGCIDTSACYAVTIVGIESISSNKNILIVPNPTSGTIEVKLDGTFENLSIEITNIMGQIILNEQHQNTRNISLKIPGPAGLYFVTITDGKGYKSVVKVIKE